MFDDVKELYQEVILDHGRKPRHGKRLAQFDAQAKGDNPMCGDRIELFVQRDPLGAIAEVGFEARGCAISIASADLMAEVARGHDAPQVRTMAARFIDMARTGNCEECDAAMERLKPLSGVHEFPSRVKCATLPWHALLAALAGTKEASSE